MPFLIIRAPSLYHGHWACSIISCDRFKALMSMLHIVDLAADDETDKLRSEKPYSDISVINVKNYTNHHKM